MTDKKKDDGRGGLLPCPFCGGEAQLRQCHCDQDTDDQELCVECLTDDCHANMVMWLGDEREVTFAERKDAAAAELTAAWNRRAALSAEMEQSSSRREVGEACEGLTVKEAWWAGYRAGKGLPADTPRSEAVTATPAPVGPGMVVVSETEINNLRTFYRAVCRLTLDHDELNGSAVVYPSHLGKALEGVDKNWFAATPPGEEAK